MIYRPSTIKRKRRTKAQIDQLDNQICEALAQHHPQSIRHVFYLMTNPRLPEPVEKTDNGYRHVQDRLTKLRRAGRIPYHWISDASRRGYHVHTYRDAADFVRSVAGLYRADLWAQSQYYVEVWTESRSLASVIQDDCEELAVSLYPAGGFSSISLAYQAADSINDIVEVTGKQPVVLFIGDYDPAGVLIDASLQKEMQKHLHCDLHFQRLGITPEQIREYDLPTKPRKASDKRSQHITETVEGEAMPVEIMRRLLRDTIESYLPPDALRVAKVAEQAERMDLISMARGLEL